MAEYAREPREVYEYGYHVGHRALFRLRPGEAIVREAFPRARVTTAVDAKRQGIVDSWPADVDDSAARRDWGFDPRYDLGRAFREYLIPTIRGRYSQ